jgi:DNA-binding NtrC family response regulator
VREGRFREDLYYRLHVIPIHIPPLREREGDVLLIAAEFLARFSAEEGKQFKTFSSEAEEILQTYTWPGNVRELENAIRNVVVLNDGETVEAQMLPPMLKGLCGPKQPALMAGDPAPLQPPSVPQAIRPLWTVEKETIERAIDACDGNIPKAAALLGISASTIYRKRLVWQDQKQDQKKPTELH